MMPDKIQAAAGTARPAPENAESPGAVNPASSSDLPRTTIGVFFMVGLAVAAAWILRPFVPALVWATMIVIALWPLMLRLQAHLWGRRWASVSVMTTALTLTFVIPFSLAAAVVVAHTDHIGVWAQSLRDIHVPQAPAWVEQLPLVGSRVASAWNEAVAAGAEVLARKLEPYAQSLARWFVVQIGGVGMLIVQFVLTLVIAAILFARGEKTAAGLLGFFRRLAGAHGEEVLILAARAIRSVALGVIVTALVQSTLGGIGLVVAGVPFPGLLTAFMFVLAVAQIGPAPVLIGALIWMYWTSDSAWAPAALLVYSIFVIAIDNVLRPILIQRGADLPLLMVFAGVVGGLLSFGVIGIFLGPVVLAVVYTLLKAWVNAEQQYDEGPIATRQSLS